MENNAYVKKCKRKGTERYATFEDGRKLYDDQVAEFAWKHMSFFDKFSFRKIVSAGLASFAIMQDEHDPNRTKEGWKFKF